MTQEINKLLEERGKTHGDFKDVAYAAQSIKRALHSPDGWESLRYNQREAIDMIASKLARIVCGNPDEHDHWRDIIGYATLVLNSFKGRKQNGI